MRPRNERDGAWAADVIAESVRGVGPGELPRRLCEVATRILPVTSASVSLAGEGMPVPLSAVDDRAAELMEIQATLGEGPCLEAARIGAPVLVADLGATSNAARWPVFAQQATAAGIRAVYALPLGDDDGCVGTLDLYRDTPGSLTARELHIARLIAKVMTVALVYLPCGDEDDPRRDGTWLTELADGHDQVFQAVGMIMARLRVGSDEALARLRARAFAHGRTVLDLAHDVVAQREPFDRE
ncbi:GAF and ANTAR domain-containing protein [Streptomyces sp.]|uniref:GAF and ANTAR domain-containing protein n=1 Tax=Streptomyces sp. TaxID=1931 RepID=UPI002B86CF2B|nr:GAF and ANTAR domain-containing protein [Streptomyces sp.]HLL37714.1 GAF and ANTAR domain-containing protein [Streptomyces sp.]HZF87213.1 GAF and ANTAR domain-containing protein [Streptomyces sp.]